MHKNLLPASLSDKCMSVSTACSARLSHGMPPPPTQGYTSYCTRARPRSVQELLQEEVDASDSKPFLAAHVLARTGAALGRNCKN